VNPLILVAILSIFTGLLTAIGVAFKTFPERRNVTVDAAQKAVGALAQAMDEISEQLEHARATIAQLQAKLDQALERVHELEAALEQERIKVQELERRNTGRAA
jgi:peptidoglycan hydrolase CwlO-like protein